MWAKGVALQWARCMLTGVRGVNAGNRQNAKTKANVVNAGIYRNVHLENEKYSKIIIKA